MNLIKILGGAAIIIGILMTVHNLLEIFQLFFMIVLIPIFLLGAFGLLTSGMIGSWSEWGPQGVIGGLQERIEYYVHRLREESL